MFKKSKTNAESFYRKDVNRCDKIPIESVLLE